MAKELPFFRFTSQEWQNGLISLESYAMKGLYIDICAYYWVQDCSVTRKMLLKKFRNARKNLQELIDLDIIKHNDETDEVAILFLNEQWSILSEKHVKRVNSGRKGGQKKASNAKAKPQQNSSYNDNNKDNENDNDKSSVDESFERFWNLYDKKVGRGKCEPKWKKVSDEDREKIFEHIPKYIASQPDKKYRKNPETYLNNQSWKDEIIESNGNNLQNPQGSGQSSTSFQNTTEDYSGIN